MSEDTLTFCLVQADIHFERIQDNFTRYRRLLDEIDKKIDIIVFPELFACGFSEYMPFVAENNAKESLLFLQEISQKYKADAVASLPIKENGQLFNCLYWMREEKIVGQYDKRHLFLGNEKMFCSRGNRRIVVNYKHWNIMPLICYDIRFPIWCRNQQEDGAFLYDCLLFIANFPSARSKTLRTLLTARAIENQSYVIGVNRIGKDGYGVEHSGNTVIINPIGEVIAELPSHKEGLLFADIDYNLLEKIRKQLPYYKDWDGFEYIGL